MSALHDFRVEYDTMYLVGIFQFYEKTKISNECIYMKQLALIDSLIPDLAIFKESLNDHTDAIIFDYYNDSLDELYNKIENGIYEKIGIVQEDNGSGRFFHQFDNNTLVEFLKSRHHCQYLDLFMCNGYVSWKSEIDQLAETNDIAIGAANTLIGQGYWTLHNGVDLCERYMRNSHSYSHVFMPKLLTVSGLTIDNKEYDKTNRATISSYTLVGVDSGDIVTLTARFDDVNVGISKSLTLDLSGQNYNKYYLQSTVSNVRANITTKTLTITGVTANNKEYSKSTTATVSGSPTLVGVISGDIVYTNFSNAYFSSYGVGTHSVYTTYTLSGSSASNYKVSSPTLYATITQKTLTIIDNDFVPDNKTYDKTITLTSSGSFDISGIYSGDECVLSGNNTFEDKNAGTNKNIIIGLSGIHAYLYKIPENVYTATIYQKEVTVSHKHFITASTKYYDGYSDVSINNWVIDGVYGPERKYLTFGATLENASVGTNKKVIYTLSDPKNNYYLTQPTDDVNGDLTTDVYANTIYYDPSTVIATSKQYDGSDSITVSTPVFRDKNNSIITLVDCSFVGTLNNVNAGVQKVTLSLSGSGASNYILTATNSNNITATITAVNLTVSGNIYASNKTYNGTTSAIVRGMSLNGAINGDSVGVSSSSSRFASATVGTWVVTPVFSLYGTSSANYTITQPTLDPIYATITTSALTVGGSISVVEKQYDGNTDATIIGAELRGLYAGDDVSLYVFGRYEDAMYGTDKKVYLTFDVSGNGLTNYTFTDPSTTMYYGNITNSIPAPTNVVARAGVQSASVSFTPPINGTVSYYVVTAFTSGVSDAYTTGYSSPIMIDNLKNSAFYKFTVTPYDVNGHPGKESSESNGITTLSDSLNYTASTGRTYKIYSASANIVTLSIPSTYMSRSVAYIGDNAFTNCINMTNLVIPSSIISIGSNAFSNCNSLTTVVFKGNRPELDEASSFNNTSGAIGYYYPDKTGWPGTAITGITLTSLLEITGTKSDGNMLTATQYLSTIGATGLTYQWYSNASNSNSGGSAISGATSSTYVYSSAYAYVYVVVNYTVSGSSTSLTSNAF